MTLAQGIYSILVASLIIVVCFNEYYTWKVKVPPAPTLPHVRKAIIRLLETHLAPGQSYNMADLGSGWGGLMFALIKHFPGSTMTGFELSPAPYLVSKIRGHFIKNLKLYRRDFLRANISPYNVIICYLSVNGMQVLKEKFERELKPGTFVISNAFPIHGWPILAQDSVGSFPKIPVFLYRMP